MVTYSSESGQRLTTFGEEQIDHDADTLNEVVIPLLNVSRTTEKGFVNKLEPHSAQFYMTSAGTKNSFAYQKAIEMLEESIIHPNLAFSWGCSYEVPMQYGLLDKRTVQALKLSPTFKPESFARELTAHSSL